jgi:glutamyl-tRNA reductase
MALEYNRPRWPDFHCWFPNQAFRSYPHNKQKMIEDMDRLLEETKFPLDRFYELMGEWSKSVDQIDSIYKNARKRGRAITQRERSRLDRMIEREKERQKELNDMIDPVYQKMLDMGYSREELQFP